MQPLQVSSTESEEALVKTEITVLSSLQTSSVSVPRLSQTEALALKPKGPEMTTSLSDCDLRRWLGGLVRPGLSCFQHGPIR